MAFNFKKYAQGEAIPSMDSDVDAVESVVDLEPAVNYMQDYSQENMDISNEINSVITTIQSGNPEASLAAINEIKPFLQEKMNDDISYQGFMDYLLEVEGMLSQANQAITAGKNIKIKVGQVKMPNMSPEEEIPQFNNSIEFVQWLLDVIETREVSDAQQYLKNMFAGLVKDENQQDKLDNAFVTLLETDWSQGFPKMDQNGNVEDMWEINDFIISNIWNILEDYLETQDDELLVKEEKEQPFEGNKPEVVEDNKNNNLGVMANMDNIEQIIKESEAAIKKMASESKGYNFTKTAQHQTGEEIVLWGPNTKRISPFNGMLETDWHVYERNKGWGFRAGDLWNIDFETVWRQNIMDKYSRPYRNKDGEWVGGYIQKRFEVDKWIPEENNLQLKPGQKRRPTTLNYEGRMEEYRGNKTYNWKEASANSKKKN